MREVAPGKSIGELIRDWLADLPPQHREVILCRHRALDGEGESLRVIGARLGVTGERIRQIEKSALRKLSVGGMSEYASFLRRSVKALGGAAKAYEVEAEEPLLDGLTENIWLVKTLQPHGSFREITIHKHHGTDEIVGLTDREWQGRLGKARTAVQHLLSSEQRPDIEALEIVIASYFPVGDASIVRLAITEILANAIVANTPDGRKLLIALESSVNDLLEAVLRELGEPAHFSDIHKHAVRRYAYKASLETLHNACGRSDRLFLFSRGTYGLLDHLRLSAGERSTLAEVVQRVVGDGEADHQWHAQELLDVVLDAGVSVPLDLTEYELSAVVATMCPTVKSMGRMVFQSDRASRTARIDVRQAVVSILRSAEGPLTDHEIVDRLSEHRGVSTYTGVLIPTEQYARTSDGRLGLVDRDFGIQSEDVDAIVDSVVKWCADRGHGLHPTEIPSAICAFDTGDSEFAKGVVAFARRSPKLRISSAGYLYPSSWAGANRLGVQEAFREIARREPSRAWFVDDLLAEVKNLTLQLQLTDSTLSARLSALDFSEYDSTAKVWRLHVPE